MNLSQSEGATEAAKVGLWLPRKWHRLKQHLEKLVETQANQLFVHESNDGELLPEEIYNLMCKEGNIFAMCSNFKYRTHLRREIEARDMDDYAYEEWHSVQSRLSEGGSQSNRRYCANSSDDESMLQGMATTPAILFLIFTKDDVISTSGDALRHNVKTGVELLRLLFPDLKLMVLMHGIRLYALHGGGYSQGDAELSQQGSQEPVIHSSALDDLICSLMVEHQVDTMEAEDDVDLAKFLVSASASVELCFRRRNAMNFKVKPQSNQLQESSSIRRMWLTQLLQIPEVGKDAAYAIASVYGSPAEVIEAVAESQEEFIRTLRNVPVGSKGSRKLGIAIARRVAALYSRYTTASDRVLDSRR